MLLVKYSIITMITLLVLVPIAVYLMLGMKHSFRNQRKMVEKQYPSLFHRDRSHSHENS